MSKRAQQIVERLRADMGGHNSLESRIGQEVLRLRLEGQEELADELATLLIEMVADEGGAK